jgi:hypothetical protein
VQPKIKRFMLWIQDKLKQLKYLMLIKVAKVRK